MSRFRIVARVAGVCVAALLVASFTQVAEADDQPAAPGVGSEPKGEVSSTQPGGETAAPEPDATLGTNFVGLNRPGSGSADPPDTIVGASGSRVLEAVNTQLRLTNTTGTQLDSRRLATFFTGVASSSGGLVFDPKVYYDRNSTRPRHYVVALQVAGRGNTSTTDNQSRILLAVSRSADPANLATSNWCRYAIDGRRGTGSAQSWADFPGLGVGADAVAITLNQFQFTNDAFSAAVVRSLRKNFLNNNASSCPSLGSTSADLTTIQASTGFTIQPAQHYTSPSSFSGTTNPLYFVSSDAAGSSTIRVWRLRNVGGGSPSFGQLSALSVAGYSAPPDALGGGVASGSTRRIDTGDARTLQVAGRGNTLHAVNTTGCQFTSSTPVEACFRYYRLSVGASSASLLETRTIGLGNNSFVHHPGVAANGFNETAITTQSHVPGNSHRLSGTVFTHTPSTSAGFPGVTFTTGTCALATGFQASRNAFRSGDYTGAQTSTDNDSFWVAAERAEVLSGVCQWGTRVARVTHP